MDIILMRFFVLFVVVAALSQFGTSSSKCLEKNNFLGQLARASPIPVAIYDTPNIPRPEEQRQCGSEWVGHGTCCNTRDLLFYFQMEKKLIDLDFLKKRESILKMHSALFNISKTDNIPQEAKYLLSKTLLEIRDIYTRCQNAYLSIRGPALCSVCSGRSEIFFNDVKDKLLIDLATCKSVISSCQPAFETHQSILNSFDKVVEGLAKNMASQNVVQATYLMESRDQASTYAPPKHLLEAFDFIRTRKTEKEQENGMMIACSMLVDIVKKPFTRVIGRDTYRIEQLVLLDYKLSTSFPEAYKLKEKYLHDIELLNQQETQEILKEADERQTNSSLSQNNSRIQISQKFETLRILREKSYLSDLEVLKNKTKDLKKFFDDWEKRTSDQSEDVREIERKQRVEEFRKNILNFKAKAIEAKNTKLASGIKREDLRKIVIATPWSRNLNFASLSTISETADSMILLKVADNEIIDTALQNPMAFVVDRHSKYQAANMSLVFP